jgi:hypothetical protein
VPPKIVIKWAGLAHVRITKYAVCLLVTCVSAGCGVNVAQPISGPTEDAADPLTRGLVAYWRLDETGANDPIVDSSGKGHAGISINGPLPSTTPPPVRFPSRGSRSFDGKSQYVLIANNDEMNFAGEVTMTAWVNLASVGPGCHYIVAHGYCATPPGEVVLRVDTPGCSSTGTTHVWSAGSWFSAEHFAEGPFNDLELGAWLHMAGAYDGEAWHLYKNGEEIGRQPSIIGGVQVASDWAIGARAPGVGPCMPAPPERYLDGLIGEVRIYNRALAPSEIVELYHQ